jgi:hypothetical protein
MSFQVSLPCLLVLFSSTLSKGPIISPFWSPKVVSQDHEARGRHAPLLAFAWTYSGPPPAQTKNAFGLIYIFFVHLVFFILICMVFTF